MRQANELDKLEMVGQLRRALEVVYDKVALMVMLRFVALLHLLYFFFIADGYSLRWNRMEILSWASKLTPKRWWVTF